MDVRPSLLKNRKPNRIRVKLEELEVACEISPTIPMLDINPLFY